jgi:glutathione peroxidase
MEFRPARDCQESGLRKWHNGEIAMAFAAPGTHRRTALLLLATLIVCAAVAKAEDKKPGPSVYDFSLVDLNDKIVPLSTYKGKLLLIVNLASQSVFHDQVAALNDLQKTYAADGLVIIGIPSSDFGGEELSDASALRKYYTEIEHPEFPVFARASLTGPQTIPLYQFLCDPKDGLPGGGVHWNFTKFLVDRQGKPIARFEAGEDPADFDFHVLVEKALAGKLDKQSPGSKEQSGHRQPAPTPSHADVTSPSLESYCLGGHCSNLSPFVSMLHNRACLPCYLKLSRLGDDLCETTIFDPAAFSATDLRKSPSPRWQAGVG